MKISKSVFWILLFILTFSKVAEAGWVDDWLTQSSTTSPGYFEGQKRGYATGGSFSARVQTSNDYLVSVQPPSFKGGCGGIDAFIGGFSFMNTDRLVNKAESMIASAPAIAFDLALTELSQTIGTSWKSIGTMVDKLNSIQLDDCKMSKAIVTRSYDAMRGSHFAEQNDEIDKMVAIATGKEDLAQDVTDSHKNNTALTNTTDSTADCPANVKAILSYDSIIAYTLDLRGLNGNNIPELIRGYLGDVSLTVDASSPILKAAYENPCDNKDFIDFTNEQIKGKMLNGNCVDVSVSGIRNFIKTNISNAVDDMKSGSVSAPDTVTFLNSVSGIPLYQYIKYMILTGQDSTAKDVATDYVIKFYAYEIFKDLMRISESLPQLLSKVTTNASYKDKCQLQQFEGVEIALAKLMTQVDKYKPEADRRFAAVVSEFKQSFEMADKMQKFNKEVSQRIMKLTYSK